MLPAHGPAGHPAGHSVSEWPDSTRDHLPVTPSSDCNAGRSEPPYSKGDRVDQGELREAATGGRSRKNSGHGRVHAAPPFPGADCHESPSVSEAASGCRLRGDACSSMVWTPRVRPLRLDTKVPANSNREYSRLFGQPPMRDIRTLRSPGAPALESFSIS